MYVIYCLCSNGTKLWARFRCGETSFHVEQKKATLFSTEQSAREEIHKHRYELFAEIVAAKPTFLVWKETSEGRLFWDETGNSWVAAKKMPAPFDNIHEAAAFVEELRKENHRDYNILIS